MWLSLKELPYTKNKIDVSLSLYIKQFVNKVSKVIPILIKFLSLEKNIFKFKNVELRDCYILLLIYYF